MQLCPPPGRTVQLRLQPSTAACPALPCPAVVVQVVLDETLMAAGTIQEVGLRNMAVRRSGRGTQAAASPGRLPAALPPSGLPAGRHHNTCPSAVSAALCVQALQTLMARQRVAYDFEFFSLDQPADAPVTVLSLGRSLLKDTVDIALRCAPPHRWVSAGGRGAGPWAAHALAAGPPACQRADMRPGWPEPCSGRRGRGGGGGLRRPRAAACLPGGSPYRRLCHCSRHGGVSAAGEWAGLVCGGVLHRRWAWLRC